MGDDENCQMGFQHSDAIMLSSQTSGMNVSSLALSSVYGTGWDPRISLGHCGNFGTLTYGESIKSSSHPMFIENQGINSSHLVTYPPNPNIDQLLPKLPMFTNRNFPDIAGGSFGLAESSQSPISRFSHTCASNRSGLDTTPLFNNVTQAERCCQIADSRAVGVSPDGKRKRGSDSMSPAIENTDDDSQKEHLSEASPQKEQDDRKKKNEHSTASDSSGKQAGKQVKENSQCEEAPKQNYIHVRAKRGQATNSHSLAERVRREKISERMRLLQELVPGCNKITGKAVMLDEIINYVQSLQQQVEFLSMKLSTVSPELNFDIERLLPKDILHSRGGVQTPVFAFQQGMGPSHTFSPGIHQSLPAVPNPASQFHHMPQAAWDNDLQSLLHMGFDSNTAVGGLGPNGSSKTDL